MKVSGIIVLNVYESRCKSIQRQLQELPHIAHSYDLIMWLVQGGAVKSLSLPLLQRPGWTDNLLIFFFFLVSFKKLGQQANKCIELCGEYVEHIPNLVAVAGFLPGRAKDLSPPPRMSVTCSVSQYTVDWNSILAGVISHFSVGSVHTESNNVKLCL